MKLARRILVILLIALLPAVGAGFFHPKRPGWSRPVAGNEIDLQTATGWGTQVLWVDARSRADFDKGHIPQAVLLNQGEWEQLIDGFLDAWQRDSKVVVYCSSLSCDASHEVAERLKSEAQIGNVYVLKGGWETWLDAHKK
jgi:rhodanese-related sulfurtransferase